MPAKRRSEMWVHVFEEDTPEGQVYKREDADIPLSRRPRERLELNPDGTAKLLVQGEDDRYVEVPAAWHEGDAGQSHRAAPQGPTVNIVQRSPKRLVVRIQKPS